MARLGTYDPQSPAPAVPAGVVVAPTGVAGMGLATWTNAIDYVQGDVVIVIAPNLGLAVGSGYGSLGSCHFRLPNNNLAAIRLVAVRDGKTISGYDGTHMITPTDASVYPDPAAVLDSEPDFGPTGTEHDPALDITPIASPALTLGTVSGLSVPIAITGAAGATHTVKLIRRSTGAVIDTETRVDNGLVTLTATVRHALYDVVAWSELADILSIATWLAGGIDIPAANPQGGAMNALLLNLQSLIAASESYQILVGAADAEAAKATIFRSRAPGDQARPFSCISLGNEWAEIRVARGASATYAESGQLYWLFEAGIAEADRDDPEAALDQFRADLDDIKADMLLLAGSELAGVPMMQVAEIGIETGIFESSKSDEAQGKFYLQAFMRVKYP